MKYHIKDLLTVLISLFVLGSCTSPSGIGLEVDPEDEVRGVLIDTLTLQAVTLRDDSARSVSFNQTAFGLFHDPVIGKTVADMAIAIGRPSTVPRIRPDAEIDSVVLVLPFGSEYFGDTTANAIFPLRVRQLDEVYAEGTFSTKQWAVQNEVIGSKTVNRFAYKSSDSVSIVKHIDGKDSLVKDIPQLRITLSPSFFKELFSESVDSALLSTAQGFGSHVKGLYLSVDESTMGGIGGLVALRGVPNIAGVELTYRQPNGKEGDDADIDTIRTFLPASTQSAPQLSSSVTHEYSAEIQAQLDQPDARYETLYAQAPAGLRVRFHIPHIDSLKGRNIAVNKAELVLYVDEGELEGTDANIHAPRLTLYREDIAGQRHPVPDGDSRIETSSGQSRFAGDGRSLWYRYNHWMAFGGDYEAAHKRYVFRLTSYVQDLLLGSINSSEFFVAPASPSENTVPFQPVLNTGGRAVIYGGSDANVKMKLNIYYTQSEN